MAWQRAEGEEQKWQIELQASQRVTTLPLAVEMAQCQAAVQISKTLDSKLKEEEKVEIPQNARHLPRPPHLHGPEGHRGLTYYADDL